jgi:hypothetical protein
VARSEHGKKVADGAKGVAEGKANARKAKAATELQRSEQTLRDLGAKASQADRDRAAKARADFDKTAAQERELKRRRESLRERRERKYDEQ